MISIDSCRVNNDRTHINNCHNTLLEQDKATGVHTRTHTCIHTSPPLTPTYTQIKGNRHIHPPTHATPPLTHRSRATYRRSIIIDLAFGGSRAVCQPVLWIMVRSGTTRVVRVVLRVRVGDGSFIQRCSCSGVFSTSGGKWPACVTVSV